MTAPGNAPPGPAAAPQRQGGNVHTLPTPLGAAAAKLHPPLRIKGGVYDPKTIMKLMNDRYFVAKWGGETQIISILPGDEIEMVTPKSFQLELSNVFVVRPHAQRRQPKDQRVPAAKYWLADKGRRERDLVIFDPHEPTGFNHPNSFNLWRGFADHSRTRTPTGSGSSSIISAPSSATATRRALGITWTGSRTPSSDRGSSASSWWCCAAIARDRASRRCRRSC